MASKKTLDYYNQIALEMGFEILSKEFVDSHTKVKCLCKNKHLFEKTLNGIQRKSGCRECYNETKKRLNKMNISNKYNFVDENTVEVFVGNKSFFVDSVDWIVLCNHHWRIWGDYVFTNIGTTPYSLHKMILKTTNGSLVDHIDQNTLDNRRSNLRSASKAQNAMNCKLSKNNKTGYNGVCFSTHHKKYAAQIMFNRKHYCLGLFHNKEDAARAYNEKAKELFGEFAKLNEIKAV